MGDVLEGFEGGERIQYRLDSDEIGDRAAGKEFGPGTHGGCVDGGEEHVDGVSIGAELRDADIKWYFVPYSGAGNQAARGWAAELCVARVVGSSADGTGVCKIVHREFNEAV